MWVSCGRSSSVRARFATCSRTLRSAVSLAALAICPPQPHVYLELTDALADPETPLAELAGIVERDVAIAAKLLRAVNGAYFGLPRRVTTVGEAVFYLGTNLVKNLVLTLAVYDSFSDRLSHARFQFDAFEARSLLAANVAKRLLGDKQRREDAFTAAMLRDVGTLVLAAYLPQQFEQLLDALTRSDAPLETIERDLIGVTHPEIGAYLLSLWGLPNPVVEAVAHHHQPWGVDHTEFDVLDAVYVANGLGDAVAPDLIRHTPETLTPLDADYLCRLGVPASDLESWHTIAVEQAEASGVASEPPSQQ